MRLRPPVALLALLLTPVGCALPAEGLLEDFDTYSPERQIDLGVDDVAHEQEPDEEPAQGGILAPEHVTVYVGEELLVDLLLEEPEVGELQPAGLPEESEFERQETGGVFRWIPRLNDVGTHDVHFLVVDLEEPGLVIGSHTIVVDVLPRFGLIEYGF